MPCTIITKKNADAKNTKTSGTMMSFKDRVKSSFKLDPIASTSYSILEKSKNLWCCEFGAWDGVKGSNTFNLVKNYNFNAVYIESDRERFLDLLKTKENGIKHN
mgnify:CR=1 FL=1